MQSENRNKITRFLRLMKAFLVSRDALIFLFFLICSSLFWFIITLDKTYEFNVNIPIEYINVPPEIEFTTELPDNFNVKLKDKGTSMITYHYKDFAPVIIDFNEYSVYSNSNLWSIQTNTLVEEDIKLQINQSTIILDYFPDEIVIEKKLLDSKKVPVKTIIDLNFKKQYFLCDDIITSPDSITLYGYKEILDYLNGECTLEEAIYILKRDTRHFAKRQLTWFRREREVIWINKNEYQHDEEANLNRILQYIRERMDISC